MWKHNNSLLNNIEYLETIKDKIEEIKQQYALPVYNLDNLKNIPDAELQFTINDQLFLDTLLIELRGKSISFSSFKVKQRNNKETNLMTQISDLEKYLTRENIEALDILKAELYEIRKEKVKGAVIRSRAINFLNDEKPAQYFCSLESHNYASKIIPKIQKDNGEIITEQNQILKETGQYYEKLYSSKEDSLIDINLNDSLSGHTIPKLNQNESDKLEGLFTLSELSTALKTLKNNCSSGTDGFPCVFLRYFGSSLGLLF